MLIKKNRLSIKKKNQSSLESNFEERIENAYIPQEINQTLVELEQKIQNAKIEANKIKQQANAALSSAENKLKEAEVCAKKIIDSANIEADKIKKNTYEKTVIATNKELEPLRNDLKSLMSKIFCIKKEALEQAHGEIINIALDLTEKIIKYKVSVDPNILKTQVIDSIKKATTDADRVQVYVNPIDQEKLISFKKEIEQLFPIGTELIVLPDESIDLGSCTVETKSGKLDAKFSTQLKALKNLVSTLELPDPKISLDTHAELPEELTIINESASLEEDIEENKKEEGKETSAASLFGSMFSDVKIEPLEVVTKETEDFESAKSPLETYLESQGSSLKKSTEDNFTKFEDTTSLNFNDENDIEKNDIEESSLFAVDDIDSEYEINKTDSNLSLYDINDENDYLESSKIRELDLNESPEIELDSKDIIEPESIEIIDIKKPAHNEYDTNETLLANEEVISPEEITDTINKSFIQEENEETVEYEEEIPIIEYEDNDNEIETVESYDTSNILKRTKNPSESISNIAKDIENNPDFKNLMDNN